jgi:hypothetical protein
MPKTILPSDEPARDLTLVEDEVIPGEWRVEYFDEEGDDYLTIFVGQQAELRARDYRDAIKEGRLETRIADAKAAFSQKGARVLRFPR